MSQTFRAGVQYNDYVGTVAADRSDNLAISDLLQEKGLIREGEYIVGFEIGFSGNDSRQVADPGIAVFLAKGQGIDEVVKNRDPNQPFNLRVVEVFDLPLADFFKYFKRFKISLANKYSGLDGADYNATE